MDISTVNIIICGIILIGLVSIFLNQIELASVALGAIAGFLSKQSLNDVETNDNTQDKNYVLLDDEA